MRRLTKKNRQNLILTAIALGAAIATAAVSFVTFMTGERLFLDEIRTRAQATLAVQAATLDRNLDKFRLLPPLLAQRPDIRAMIALRDPVGGERVAAIVAAMSGAREVVFLDALGRPLSSSAWAGRNVSGGPLPEFPSAFAEAMEGRLGRELLPGDAFSTASYVFASAVRTNGIEVGVVAVRVDLASVEQAWALSKDPLVAVDDRGEIIVTNRPQWRGRKFVDITTSELRGRTPSIADISYQRRSRSGFDLIRLNDGDRTLNALHLAQPLPLLGWTVATFSDTTLAHSQAEKATIIALLACLLLCGIGWVALERRRATLRRMRDDRAAALRLERRVRERTHDLSEANRRLASEVKEREAAEAELRQTQAELVQAAKLATLGRMSAALSHEFNQPLAAIRSNAENAQILLSRDMGPKAEGNLAKIIAMVERMAEISRTLKGFSRRAGTETKPVRLNAVVDEALMLLSPRIKRSRIEILVERPQGDPIALAGHIRLEQVVLNLLSNALDAVGERADGIVRLTLRDHDEHVVIEVADNGPGVALEDMPNIFDPFFTTKEVGEGLGLGLSIAYKIVHDFDGTLTVSTAPEGGALFTVRLPRGDGARRAAAE